MDGALIGRVILAGGSGFVGRQLAEALRSAGREPLVMGRGAGADLRWDAKTVGEWASAFEGADAVVNLTGENIAQKWTLEAQKTIVASRVESTEAIGRAIEQCANPPRLWINASAVGLYGDRGDEVLTEHSAPGDEASFLVSTCLKWEAAQDQFKLPRTIQSKVRIGFVCGRNGGGLPILQKLTRSFLGGAVGSGHQYMSWIHERDLVRLFVWMIDGERGGVFNGTAPEPHTNQDFMSTMRAVAGRPWSPPAPSFALRLASAFGAPDPDVLLMSQRAIPNAATEAGFQFDFPTLEAALRDLA